MAGRRVLVVEDEPLVAETIAIALNEAYSVSVAATVVDAVQQLRETQFAGVLLDCLLPDGDTGEVVAAAEARGVAVILMSGDPQQIESFWAAGHPFLAKPFSIEELQKTLRTVLTLSRAFPPLPIAGGRADICNYADRQASYRHRPPAAADQEAV
jgi:DNA-binding response OmpR family regulator